jgi:hypothetical protein
MALMIAQEFRRSFTMMDVNLLSVLIGFDVLHTKVLHLVDGNDTEVLEVTQQRDHKLLDCRS